MVLENVNTGGKNMLKNDDSTNLTDKDEFIKKCVKYMKIDGMTISEAKENCETKWELIQDRTIEE